MMTNLLLIASSLLLTGAGPTAGVGGDITGLIRVYSGGTVTPSGWLADGHSPVYLEKEVYVPANLFELDANGTGNIDGTFDISSLPSLATLDCSGGALTSLSVAGSASILFLSCYENHITALDVSGCPALTNVNARDNALNAAAVDAVLAALVTNGATGGVVSLQGTNAAPTAAGLASKSTLESRSWTVTVTP